MSTVNVNLQDAFAAPANVLVTIKSVLVASQNVTVGTSGVLPFKASGRTNASGSVSFVLPTGRYQISASSPSLDGVPYQPLIDVPNDAANYEHTQLIVSGASPFTQPISTNVNASDSTFGLVKLVLGAALPARIYTQAQLAAWFGLNVLEYGADPTGAADSRAAFVAALAALPAGGVLWAPPGTYKISAVWDIAQSNFKIVGNGMESTKLQYSGAGMIDHLISITGDGWTLHGLKIDSQTKCKDTLRLKGNDWTLEKCYLLGAYADDTIDPTQTTIVSNVLVTKASQRWRIAGNKFGAHTFAVAGSRAGGNLNLNDFGWATAADNINGEIIGNHFLTAGPAGTVDGNGIILGLTYASYDCGVRITDNYLEDFGRSAIKLLASGVIATGNFIDCSARTGARAGFRIYGHRNTITGNTIRGPFVNYGIEGGTTLYACNNNTYTGNTIAFTGTPSAIGILLQDLSASTRVAGNNISGQLTKISFAGSATAQISYGSTEIVQAANQNIASNTTLADSSELKVGIAANTNYKFKAKLLVTQAGTVGGWKVSINGPAAPTSFFAELIVTPTGGGNVTGNIITALDTALTGGTGSAFTRVITLEGVIRNGANAGTLAVRVAQAASDATVTAFLAGSFFEVEEVS